MTPEWEAALQKLERYTDRLPYRFERVMIGKLNAIRLVGDRMGSNIPLRRTLWSLTFPDQYARDRFYCWLCHHIDRWGDWGTRAWQNGPRALSEYLLQLKFADERAVTPDRPSSIMPRTTGGLFEGRPLSFIRGAKLPKSHLPLVHAEQLVAYPFVHHEPHPQKALRIYSRKSSDDDHESITT